MILPKDSNFVPPTGAVSTPNMHAHLIHTHPSRRPHDSAGLMTFVPQYSASFIILEQLGYLARPMSAAFTPPSKDAPRYVPLLRWLIEGD